MESLPELTDPLCFPPVIGHCSTLTTFEPATSDNFHRDLKAPYCGLQSYDGHEDA